MITGVIVSGYCHIFHLDQPGRVVHGSDNELYGYSWKAFDKHSPNNRIIGSVTKIDYYLRHIGKTYPTFFKQLLHILPHPPGLFPDIAYMNHFVAMIDTRRTADKEMMMVATFYESPSFESHPI